MKALKLSFILLDFLLALAMSFFQLKDHNKIDTYDDYSEHFEQYVEKGTYS
ncbi:MAG: hypothetical protein ISR55_05365 [Bacteroidetes bacterium]|nr:hypothetical protein [Bacteroidota bacterium]MBL6963232.1 hypothetical protein [Bacteroidota bacterium]